MSCVDSKALEVLLKLLELTFTSSSFDRKQMHNIEWEAEDYLPSILGEVEVRADTVIGIARSCLKKQPDHANELVKMLLENSVYNSDSTVSWVATVGIDFHDFLSYIAAIENLRMGTVALLQKA